MKSLSDERVAFPRWACVEAARTIIQEVLVAYAAEETRLRLWNDQVIALRNLTRAITYRLSGRRT